MTSRLATLFALFILLLIHTSCSPPEPLQLETGTFERADIDHEEFYAHYSESQHPLDAVSGRANVQISEPGNTERLTIKFLSDRNQSLLIIRNNLGMEGGRIYSDPDSVIIYNRLEEEAHKMSHADAAWYYLHGITALNLIQILHPITDPGIIADIYESNDFYLVETRNGDRHIIERETMRLRQTEREVHHPDAFSTFHFENYASIEGHQMPRRIQILSSDENSNIFFLIRALEVNPSSLEFDPDIPGDIEIIRL